MDELQKQLSELEAQKVALFDSGNPDQDALNRINEQIKEVQEKLNAINIAEEVRTSEFPYVLEVGGQSINFRDWIAEEENYQVIAIGVSQKIYELETTRNAQIAELTQRFSEEREQFINQIATADEAVDAKYNELYEQFQSMRAELQTVKAERDDLREERHTLKTERDDFERKHQAAVTEIDSLKSQLQTALIKEKPVATNMDSNALAEAIKRANANKPAVYNMREVNGHYIANLAETDEEININWLDKGKYRVLSEQEVQRFREDREEAKVRELESIPEVAVTVEPVDAPPLQFHNDGNTDDTAAVQEHVLHGTVASEPVEEAKTIKERLTALELAVFGKETKAVA